MSRANIIIASFAIVLSGPSVALEEEKALNYSCQSDPENENAECVNCQLRENSTGNVAVSGENEVNEDNKTAKGSLHIAIGKEEKRYAKNGDSGESMAASSDGNKNSAESNLATYARVYSNAPLKASEFITYTLSALAILISAIVLVIGVFSGVALSVVIRVKKEREDMEKLRGNLDEQQKNIHKKLTQEYSVLIDTMKRTAFELGKLHRAKKNVRELLAKKAPDVGRVYAEIQKTVQYPDLECLALYGEALEKFEGNVDIVRCVRNGIVQYKRNPDSDGGQRQIS